jgi:hypothetical protein
VVELCLCLARQGYHESERKSLLQFIIEVNKKELGHNSLHYILVPKGAFMPREHLPIRVVGRLVQPIDLSDQIHRTATILQVGPLATIPDSEDAVCDRDGATFLDAECSCPVEACPEHVDTHSSIFCVGAFVQPFEGHAVLESALLYELFAWDVLVLVRHAHREAKIDLRVWVLTSGAEFEHVAEALLRTVHAGDAIVVVGDTKYMLVSMREWYTRFGVLWRLTFQCKKA